MKYPSLARRFTDAWQENNPFVSSLCLPWVTDRQIPYNPGCSLQAMCLPGFPITPRFTSSLPLLCGQGKIPLCPTYQHVDLPIWWWGETPSLSGFSPSVSRHIACSGVSLKFRLWPKLRCTLTPGQSGSTRNYLSPHVKRTSRGFQRNHFLRRREGVARCESPHKIYFKVVIIITAYSCRFCNN